MFAKPTKQSAQGTGQSHLVLVCNSSSSSTKSSTKRSMNNGKASGKGLQQPTSTVVVLRSGAVREVRTVSLVRPQDVNVDYSDAVARVTRSQLESFVNHGKPTHPHWIPETDDKRGTTDDAATGSVFAVGDTVDALYRKNLTGYWYVVFKRVGCR